MDVAFASCMWSYSFSTRAHPTSLRVEASSVCQLACPSCPTASGETQKVLGKGHLSPEKLERLFRENPGKIEVIELSNYGEAFLNPKLVEIFRIAHEHRVALTINNGANLNHAKEDALEGLIRYGVLGLTCSIDGASQETYQMYRRRGDFDTVIRHIRRINEHKRRYNAAYPRLCWQFVVFGHNEHEIDKARAMAKELGMFFKPKLSWDSGFSPIVDIETVKRKTGFRHESREKALEKTGDIVLSDICHQLWDTPQINYDGRVLGCCANYWGDFGGNAFEDLDAALNSEKMQYARAMLMGKAKPREDVPCTSCDVFKKRLAARQFLVRLEPKRMAKQWGEHALVRYDSLRAKLARKGLLASGILNPSRV